MTYEREKTILKVENVSLNICGKQILRDVNFEIKDIVKPNCITGQIPVMWLTIHFILL